MPTTRLIREGGAEMCDDQTVYYKVVKFTGTCRPPWILYGKQVNADYVVVGWLTQWKIGDEKAINYCPGSASLQLQIYDVEEENLCWEKSDISANVGQDELESMFHNTRAKTEIELMKGLAIETRKIFIGSANNLD
jgi:hypothetical protein